MAKILLEYIKQNREDLDCLFGLANLFRLRATFDLHFLHVYFKYELYEKTTPAFKKRLFVNYFRMYRETDPNEKDTEKILAISKNIIYEFILIEINALPEERSILVSDDEIMQEIIETVKVNLNPRVLHSNYSSNLDRNANNYREAIEILQITNLAMSAMKDTITESDKSAMLLNVWGLLRL